MRSTTDGLPGDVMASAPILSHSDAETEAIGTQLASRLGPGARVLLYGELGAGKTAFVRGLAQGLGIDPDEVSSPTFTLVQEYRGRLPLYHVDLYRLAPGEVDDLGLDALAADGVLAIEWAERMPRADPGAIDVRLEHAGEDSRRVTVTHPAPYVAEKESLR
ncbi:MAG: tRNA (adenosine(37)-N6)-threonylcarbamoyltransferase complex ATPase subunit type 1 TsaE [Vicinamibacteraceae bacterium]